METSSTTKEAAQVESEFAGRVAVITGGSGVLCSAIARALGARGAHVVVVGHRNLDRAERIAKEINSGPGKAIAAQADVLSRPSLEALAQRTLDTFGKVDILINGAGGGRKEASTSDSLSFFDLPEDAIRYVLDLNFLSTFLACQVFGRIMVQQDRGCILNFSSMTAIRPLTRVVAYGAGKAALTNFTQWLAVHMAQNYSPKLRVNAIAPGFFLTEQNRFLLTDEKTGELTARGRAIVAHTPQGRFGVAEDLIGAALFLLSDSASFVHGVVLPVDGGFSACSGV